MMHSINKGCVQQGDMDPIADINGSVKSVILLQGLTGLAISSCLIARVMNAFRNPSLSVYVGGCLKPRHF